LQHAFKLYQAGMSDVDVARNTGIKRTTFIRYRKKYRICLLDISMVGVIVVIFLLFSQTFRATTHMIASHQRSMS
jgi:hypothetical protein